MEAQMITRQTILNLIKEAQNPSISIYMPTHVKGEQVQQDPIRFKNALKEVEEQLREHEVEEGKIGKLLHKPRELLEQPMFWQQSKEGFVVFITEDLFVYYRLPLKFDRHILVEDYFLITPLLPMVTLEGTFCILALSQKEVRLFKATRQSVAPLKLKEAPTSMEEFLQYNVQESNLKHHMVQGAGRGNAKALFHNQGAEDDTGQREVENYLKHIENEVTSKLRKRHDPLILAGVKEAIAGYKKVNHYDRLLDESITHNPDGQSKEELRDQGWGIIKSWFLQDMYGDMDRLADLTNSDKRSDNLSEIVEASYYGKVDSLFVPIGEKSWGWFDEERNEVHLSAGQQNGEHDLINMAATKTLIQGGNVYALDKQNMPQNSTIAAIFRYS